ncbi:MAG TPA: hypothetical protein VHN20_19220 [Beijerinckiaceae bacterium]|nr:hypothetical protein [Beijerinckiaceae bacterium]
MTIPVSAAAAAAFLLVAVAAAAPAQSAPLSGPSGIILAQATSPGSDTPARRSRRGREGASKKEPSTRQLATKERQRRCAAEWKAAKAAGKVEAGMKWPKYWSACNARLKGTAA